DGSSHQLEMIPGPEYLAMSYYEMWFRGLSQLLVKHGFVTPAEMTSGRAAPGAAKASPLLSAEDVTPRFMRRGSYVREGGAPAFAEGDTVRARDLNPPGHT